MGAVALPDLTTGTHSDRCSNRHMFGRVDSRAADGALAEAADDPTVMWTTPRGVHGPRSGTGARGGGYPRSVWHGCLAPAVLRVRKRLVSSDLSADEERQHPSFMDGFAGARVLVTGGSGFIGTNLVAAYRRAGVPVVNADIEPPRNREDHDLWVRADVTQLRELRRVLSDVQPTHIFHLAARTDLDGKTPQEYHVNVAGVQNLLTVVKETQSVVRAVVASSRMVCRIGYEPQSDHDYCPLTAYGASKVETERLTRLAAGVPWVIVRPTSIWGPWFDVPYRDFFMSIARGHYVHPAGAPILKSYGFVGNTVWQLHRIMTAPSADVVGRTFYVADDPPLEVRDFANRISATMGRRAPRNVDRRVLRGLAYAGDAIEQAGIRAPLTRFRLNNLLTPMVHDVQDLMQLTGRLPYDEQAGVSATVEWMRHQGLVDAGVKHSDTSGPGTADHSMARREAASVARKGRLRRLRKSLVLLGLPQWRRAGRIGVAAAVEHRRVPFGDSFATILDVGAHHGQFYLLARSLYPAAEIVCIEPLADAIARLGAVQEGDDRAAILPFAAAGVDGSQDMHVSRKTDSSSLLPILNSYVSAFPGTEEARTVRVRTRSLDSLVPGPLSRPALLKIDVQGGELDVLRGASRLLSQVDAVFVECSFVQFYGGQALADEVIAALLMHGLRLEGVYSVVRDRDSRCLQADLLFRSSPDRTGSPRYPVPIGGRDS